MAAEPIPASLEKTPLATPNRIALIIDATIVPQSPPPTAFTENAIWKIIEVADEKTPDRASEVVCEQIKEKEAQRLMRHVREDAYVIALAIEGKQLDSVELAQKIDQLGITGKSQIQFVIGGSLGLHESLLKRADYKLSFSKMTFPHQLMRVILLEQIYRSYRIIAGEPYHK